MKGKKRWVLAAAGLALLVLFLLAADPRLKTVAYEVATDEVNTPIRLAVLTDLHSCAYGEGQSELLEAVAGAAPDGVLLVGDIVDDVLPEENAWVTLTALTEAYPCYYVTGNHEWWSGEAERICADMETLGISVLRGDSAAMDVKGNNITVCGVDDPDSGLSERQLEAVGAQVAADGFHVLLAHRPERIDDYLKYPFDLVLSGHAHGGQWRLPGLINGLYAPHQGLFPPYAGGRYDFEDAVFLVSRGLARESTKVPRLFNRPELVMVDIVPEASA